VTHGTGIICAQLAAFVLGGVGEEVIDHAAGQGGELAQFLPEPACQATCMPFLPGSRSWPREEHDCATATLEQALTEAAAGPED
jgi:hypothetical protein